MTQQLGKQRVRLPQTLSYSLITQLNADRQRVDEQSQRSVGPFSAIHPSEQQCPEYHLILSREAA